MTNSLALNGGPKTRQSWLAYGKQFLDDEDRKAVSEALLSDFITRGPRVEQFEQELCEFADAKYAIAFSSATAGLHAAMAMYGVGAGDHVIVPAITFAATANAARYCGATVEFVDVRKDTLNIDEQKLEASLINQSKVVAPVDFAGNPCDYSLLNQKVSGTNCHIVSDAAHSMGAHLNGKPVGALADASVFSFHPVKSMTTAEGGAVLVNDSAQAEFLKQFRNHGISTTKKMGVFAPQEFLGFNYHFTEIQAALGLSQLKKLSSFILRRQEIAARYLDKMKSWDLIELPQITTGSKSSWHLFPIRLNLSKLSVDRDQIMKALHAENIGVQVHYVPVYWHPYYESQGYKKGLCPVAEAEFARELSIPIFPQMTDSDQDDVLRGLEKVLTAFKA